MAMNRNYVVLLLTLVGSVFLSATCLTCLKDVSQWENIFRNSKESVIPLRHWGNKSYWIGDAFQVPWYEAVTFCSQIHMQLLTITCEEENEQIFNYLKDAGKGFEYWTSGNRVIDQNKWLWLPYGKPVEYTKWSVGQPSDPVGEKCLQVWKIGEKLEWNDRPCWVPFYFICERYNYQNLASDKC
ncbi:perlucin-like isoform X2 [Diabrotica virgifera virgifera]|uniref:C-type lectin domain-containing protein n=1 Tax=Diabrotica virgifera virgifera TaxID=50390 RepID=A0ABM5ID54_DIAVI|nr:perlucin-like isoform X2 [Diabrotica virgifera virgifera]